ncbi:MAG: Y-family DNA polymerase [Candidatus Cloacimonetes bacterium]|nr:Y-family DNA polymerase [Candidatus Cloacimonadota bacterium]
MPGKERYALVDCNQFYVSCERVFRPQLWNKPVGVLSNNDGCLVALSPEMKALGIKRGVPAFKINDLVKKHDIQLFSSNYGLYGDLSARVMQILSEFTPELEIYSIDEAFLRLDSLKISDWQEYGRKMRGMIMKWVGLPVSVGLGPTKTLAKIANRVAKKFPGYQGVFDITDHPKLEAILQWIQVEDIWGVGYRYAQKLNSYGIKTAWDLSKADYKWVQQQMTIVGLRTVKELNGISCLDMELDMVPKKQIISSRSFGHPVSELNELLEAVADYCQVATLKLRQQHSLASSIMVYLTTNRFRDEPQYANYAGFKLATPSAYVPDFIKTASDLLRSIYRPGYKFKKVGVMLSNIIAEGQAPLDFFDRVYIDDERKIVMDCLDKVNKVWGPGTLAYAAAGINKGWQMKRQLLSPSYTSNWWQLLRVNSDRTTKRLND